MKRWQPQADAKLSSIPGDETPLPSYAPFAVPSEAIWQDLQRRRSMIRLVRTMVEVAREQGYSNCAAILADAAERICNTLIVNDSSAIPTREEAERELAAAAF